MTRSQPQCAIEVVGEGEACEMFVLFDGVRIAKRGRPGTPQARTWIAIEPGFAVFDDAQRAQEIVITRDGVPIQ